MTAKKILIPILAFCAAICITVGCAPVITPVKTEFDDMEIVKIEAAHWEGFAPFPGYYLRTFDFKYGTVCDTKVPDKALNEIIGNWPGYTAEDFNNPKQVATFTQEQAITLYETIRSLGILAWEAKYITDDIICDGGRERVTVCFADGTEKSTDIYFKYPPKYDEVLNAFEEYFGVGLYYFY